MRRADGLWHRIACYPALEAAARRASLGKRDTAAVAAFLDRRESECLRLEEALQTDAWRPSPGATFRIADPKPRTITVVPFSDQVVHHALIGALEPIFERRMIYDTYACRRGKGTHRAISRVQHYARRHRFVARMDIQQFFASIRHDRVRRTLVRLIKDRRVLRLVDRVLRATPGGRGLPIGSLTSQWFANMLLDPIDHLAKETLRLPGYVRYMDDLVLFMDTKRAAWQAVADLGRALRHRLDLTPKPCATRVSPTNQGVPFLGRIIYPNFVRLRPEQIRRYAWRMRLRHGEWLSGRRDDDAFVASVDALVAMADLPDRRRLRRRLMRAWTADL